jgi:hypothetical protein
MRERDCAHRARERDKRETESVCVSKREIRTARKSLCLCLSSDREGQRTQFPVRANREREREREREKSFVDNHEGSQGRTPYRVTPPSGASGPAHDSKYYIPSSVGHLARLGGHKGALTHVSVPITYCRFFATARGRTMHLEEDVKGKSLTVMSVAVGCGSTGVPVETALS